MFTNAFLIVAHMFVFWYTFDWWGQGNPAYITLSVCFVLCACYSFALAAVPEGSNALRILYQMRYYWLGFMLVMVLCLSGVFSFGLIAFQVSDQIAIYTISGNVNLFCFVTLFPMIAVTIFSFTTWEMRYYEMTSQDITFDSQNSGLVDPDTIYLSTKPKLTSANQSSSLNIN